MKKIEYFSKDVILGLNAEIISMAGGKTGQHKDVDLDFLLFKIRNDFNFKNRKHALLAKAAFIVYFVNHLSHTFPDGNKRTSVEAAKLLLKLNGYYLHLPLKESVKFLLQVSCYVHSHKSVMKWLKKHAIKLKPSKV